MNRFRTKKKAREAPDTTVRDFDDFDAPPTLKPSKTWGLGKRNNEPEIKKELDLTSALPSTDDFRTSLLMNGLSARFSMLREQDDPHSKLGKASDDSVLFPSKRQSRLNNLNYQSNGLSDIAEVSSINGSIRPPFAFERTNSYGSGAEADDNSEYGGSIMNRAKPGEGNNLFGGRQKIYKIPANGGKTGGGMGGRALYDDDVSKSAFQKLREHEKEQRERELEAAQDTPRAESPPLSGYNRNRETSSTTSSGGAPTNGRVSTAATSINSQGTPSLSGYQSPTTTTTTTSNPQGLEKSVSKTRRLYETGLDQTLHEQQNSAMHRIDTLTRVRPFGTQTPPPGLNSPNGFNAERWDRQQLPAKGSMPNLRTASPPPSTLNAHNFDWARRPSNLSEPKQHGLASPPLSPPVSESEDHPMLPVQPNDKGKATALGAFQKPTQAYDENKYTQRQLQMRQGRETPPPPRQSPPRQFAPRQAPPPLRTRADSNSTYASARSSSNSEAQRQQQNGSQERMVAPSWEPPAIPKSESKTDVSGTFLSSPNGSSMGDSPTFDDAPKIPTSISNLDLGLRSQAESPRFGGRPLELQHPALRKPHQPEDRFAERSAPSSPAPEASAAALTPPQGPQPPDSPTLGPTSGLNGMVFQHLRSESNSSSIYGAAATPSLVSRFPDEDAPQHDYVTKDNPWDADDWEHADYSEPTVDNTASRPKPDVPTAPLRPAPTRLEAAEETDRKASWEKEMEAHHARTFSTETQKERVDFQNELASRRRRVQEQLKSFADADSRSNSPIAAPSSDWQREKQSKANPLGLLKKNSRTSVAGNTNEPTPSKAMKMLGLAGPSATGAPTPTPVREFLTPKQIYDNARRQEEESRKRDEEESVSKAQAAPGSPPRAASQVKALRQARREQRQVAPRNQRRPSAPETDPEWQARNSPPNSIPSAQLPPAQGPPVQSAPQGQSRQQPPPFQPTQQPPFQPSQSQPIQPIQPLSPRNRVPQNMHAGRSPSRERRAPPITMRRNAPSPDNISVGSGPTGSRPPSRTTRDRSSSEVSEQKPGRIRNGSRPPADGQGLQDILAPPRLMTKSPGSSFQPSPIPSPMPNPNSPFLSGNNRSPAVGYFDSKGLQPLRLGDHMDASSPRPSPVPSFSANATPPLAQPSPAGSGANTPTTPGFQGQSRNPTARKRSIVKSEIGEPTLISSTSRVTTVDLPPGSSLKNGTEPPPIPPVNPRRRQTRGKFAGLMGKKEEEDTSPGMGQSSSQEELSTFSADEGDSKPRVRQKLRKSSSEGGNLNARARQAAAANPGPEIPRAPVQQAAPPGMF